MENKKFVLLSMIGNDFSMPQFFDTLADAQEEMSKEYNLYRQDYCGCKFSKRDRDKEKELNN